jgi:hypothetical protein
MAGVEHWETAVTNFCMDGLITTERFRYKVPLILGGRQNSQVPIDPTHSPKDRFTQFLERRQNFTHFIDLCMVYSMDTNEINSVNLMCNYKCVDEAKS